MNKKFFYFFLLISLLVLIFISTLFNKLEKSNETIELYQHKVDGVLSYTVRSYVPHSRLIENLSKVANSSNQNETDKLIEAGMTLSKKFTSDIRYIIHLLDGGKISKQHGVNGYLMSSEIQSDLWIKVPRIHNFVFHGLRYVELDQQTRNYLNKIAEKVQEVDDVLLKYKNISMENDSMYVSNNESDILREIIQPINELDRLMEETNDHLTELWKKNKK
jgi:hypothetical protein